MSTTETRNVVAHEDAAKRCDLKLEVVVIPVSDVDRSKAFYADLGWRLDADFSFDNGFRIVQFTPPGSPCSVQFGTELCTATPGSAKTVYLVVSDIEAARKEVAGCGVDISEVFHPGAPGAQFQPDGADGRVRGADDARSSYGSFATFCDPDGNGWMLQEVTTRLPNRVDADTTSYASVTDLADAMRRASVAHGEHEARIGKADPDWPDWYASYMLAEQAGTTLPQ
jgi:catechol 2,3-dioxygenase-like lactoylglutathione lyase family enzyme